MAQFNLSTACLLLLLSVSLFIVQAHTACCTTYSRGILPRRFIKGFSIQNNYGECNINAIIFVTLKGKQMCADPAKPWVLLRIQQLKSTVQEMTKNIKHRVNDVTLLSGQGSGDLIESGAPAELHQIN